MDLYFDCNFGISGDMAVASLLDLGADRKKLDEALSSLNLENEFSYEITDKLINSIHATDFNVILPKHHGYHHTHRNLDDIVKIIDKAMAVDNRIVGNKELDYLLSNYTVNCVYKKIEKFILDNKINVNSHRK